MKHGLAQLPPPVAAALRAYARRKRALHALRLAAAVGIVYAALLLLATHMDRFAFLSVEARRVMLWAVHALTAATALGGAAWLATRRWTWRQIAYEVEAELGGRAGERLVTLENLAARPASSSRIDVDGAAAWRFADPRRSGAPQGSPTHGLPAEDSGQPVAPGGQHVAPGGQPVAPGVAVGGDATLAASAAADLAVTLERSVIELTRDLRGGALVRDPIARRLGWLAAATIVLLAALSAWRLYQFPLMLERFYLPWRDLPRASFIDLQVGGEQAVLGMGAEAVIQVRVVDRTPWGLGWLMNLAGASPRGCLIALATTGPAETGSATTATRPAPTAADVAAAAPPQRMVRVQRDLFLFTRADVRESFAYRLRAGNAETATRQVRVVAQPRILETTLIATPPAYAALPPITATDPSQGVQLLAGSRLELRFRTDQAVTRRALRFEKSARPIEADWDEATRTARHEWTLKEPAGIEIEVANAAGFGNVDRVAWRIGVREDQPPTVRVEEPGPEVEAVAGSLLELRGQAEDDLGVAELAVRYVLNPDPNREASPRELLLPMEKPGERRVSVASTVDLDKTGAAAGDVVLMQLRARDARGGDGLSRAVLVRVVPFARGAEERRRIAGLRAVSRTIDALTAAATQPAAPTNRDIAAINPDVYRGIVKWAGERGVPMNEEPRAASVLVTMENEHYLTADPHDQADLRAIHGQFQWLTTDALLSEAWRTHRVEALRRLRSHIDALADYRQGKNLAWRLFGLRDEATRVSDTLAALLKLDKPSDEALNRANRRCSLYLAALQDAGVELIELCRGIDAASGEKATQLVGALNETGYFIGRGSLARRRSSAQQIGEQIAAAMELLRGKLAVLQKRGFEARPNLAYGHDRVMADVAGVPICPEAKAWWRAQARLLDREPMAPTWPRVVALSAGQWLSKVERANANERAAMEAARQLAMMVLVGPIVRQVNLVVADDVLHEELRHLLRFAAIHRAAGLSGEERHLEGELAAQEYKEAVNTIIAVSEMTGPPLWVAVTRPAPGTPLVTSRDEMPGRRVMEQARHINRELAELARKHLDDMPWPRRLKSCAEQSSVVEASLQRVAEALEQGQGDASSAARALALALSAQSEALAAAVDALAMDLRLLPGEPRAGAALRPGAEESGDVGGDAGAGADAVLMQLRELAGRYEQRVAAARTALAANEGGVSSQARAGDAGLAGAPGAALSAQQMGDIKAQLPRLKVVQETLRKGLDRLAQVNLGASAPTQGAGTQPVVSTTQPADAAQQPPWLARTAMMARVWLRVTDKTRTDDFRRWLWQLPGAEPASALLPVHAPAIATVRERLASAQQAMGGERRNAEGGGQMGDAAALKSAVEMTQSSLNRLGELAKLIGPERMPAGVSATLAAAATAMASLPKAGGDLNSAAAQARWRMALPELVKRLAALERALKAEGEAGRSELSEPDFRGGPADAWSEAYRFEGQVTRKRLVELWRMMSDAALAELAAGAMGQRGEARPEGSYACAALAYRLARSSLAGSGGVQATTRPSGATADPFLEFLRGELNKAKQRQKQMSDYAEPTRAYLDSVGDYLRY